MNGSTFAAGRDNDGCSSNQDTYNKQQPQTMFDYNYKSFCSRKRQQLLQQQPRHLQQAAATDNVEQQADPLQQ
jgi:hypothetical protein